MPSSVRKEIKASLDGSNEIRTLKLDVDFIHAFVREIVELKKSLPSWRKNLAKTGSLWISWPKKTSTLATDLSGDLVREIGLAAGLVDIKVCAVDENWSALKFVFRRADRESRV